MTASMIADVLAGHFDRWHWSPDSTVDDVALAVGCEVTTGAGRLGERLLDQAVVTVPAQPHPVRFRWEPHGALALAELAAPVALPSWPAVIDALGEPDLVIAHGRGPYPGADQRCHLDRGLTVFDGAGLGYQAVWLYPPMTAAEYPKLTGALETPRRGRRA
jgi:hypothetical protein